jgi:hypothetical protein
MSDATCDRAVGTTGAWVRAALAAAGVAMFYTGLDNYAFQSWSAPAPIKFVWLFVAAAAALVLLNARAPMALLESPLLLWIFGYFLMTTLWSMWSLGNVGATDQLRARLRSVGFLVAFAVMFDESPARRSGVLAVAAAALFASCVNVAELFGLLEFAGEEGRVAGRSGGFYINANGAGIAIVMGLAVVIPRIPARWRLPLLVTGVVGVLTTFSRGAVLCLAVLVTYLLKAKQIGRWRIAAALIALAILLAAEADMAMRWLDAGDVLTQETAGRLRLEHSDSGRAALALAAWREFLASPLIGNGIAATVQPHNQFLALAGDHGLLGLVALPLLAMAVAFRNAAGIPFALVLLTAGLFSHNLLDDRASLILIALASARDVSGAVEPARGAGRERSGALVTR